MSCGVGPGGIVKTFPRLVVVGSRKACIQVGLVGVLKDGLVPLARDAVVHNRHVVVHVQREVGKGPVDDAAAGTGPIAPHASHRVPDGRCSQSAGARVQKLLPVSESLGGGGWSASSQVAEEDRGRNRSGNLRLGAGVIALCSLEMFV